MTDISTESEPQVLGAIGDVVFIADGQRLARWTARVGVRAVQSTTPEQYLKFNGGYMTEADPQDAVKALQAYQDNPPEFVAPTNFDPAELATPPFDPDQLDMTGVSPESNKSE